MRKSLTRICMLKKRDDIKRVFSSKRVFFNSVLIRCCANGQDRSRFVIVPERKAHGAVDRNLIRRRISEILRINQGLIKVGFDIAFFVKRDVLLLSYSDLADLLMKALDRGRLLEAPYSAGFKDMNVR